MLSEDALEAIEQHVDQRYFDKGKIVDYLNIHSVVGSEIFPYCDKHAGEKSSCSYSRMLDNKLCYKPLTVKEFIRRMPFFFFVEDRSDYRAGNLDDLLFGSTRELEEEQSIERLYQALEYMYYDKKISLPDIFSYMTHQVDRVKDIEAFFQWEHYLRLCDEIGCTDYLPTRFIVSYNEVLEQNGLPPIIYEINEIFIGEVYWRRGTEIEFEGIFPCDQNDNPIMKWIGLRVENEKSITCIVNERCRGRLVVELSPTTVIQALNCYNSDESDEDCWYQLYAGPQLMEFEYHYLKVCRERMGYTQKQVAEAIGASLRTYQKWESGETTPDGHYLLRLLNWLDIYDIQHVIEYREPAGTARMESSSVLKQLGSI